MRVKKVLAGAALGLGLGAAVAPAAAFAQPGDQVVVTPQTATANSVVQIQAPCLGSAQISGPNVNQTINLTQVQAGTGPASTNVAAGSITVNNNFTGTYNITVICQDGRRLNGQHLIVTPKGAPRGGDGGKVENAGYVTGGTALLGAAAAGFVLMRRRVNAGS